MRELIDLRTGEPVIDFNGNLKEASLKRAFNQYIDIMLHTPIGEEIALLTWGFPYKQLFQLRFGTSWQDLAKYYIVEALNPRREPLIDNVKSVAVERNNNAIDIDLQVVSAFNTENEIKVSLNE